MKSHLPLFPTLDYSSVAHVNLDEEARRWYARHPEAVGSPLSTPPGSVAFVEELHRKLGVEWSWGSYLENRSVLLRQSYLEKTGNFMHLGIDCNMPAGTLVAAPFPCTVLVADNDRETRWGWGPRLILEGTDSAGQKQTIVLAHFEEGSTSLAGAALEAGARLGLVGAPPGNGNWFPHIHIQQIKQGHLATILKQGVEYLDGYGNPQEMAHLREIFPDPAWVIGF